MTIQRVANSLFLMFCHDDYYRDAYELYDRIAMDEHEKEIEDPVRTGGDNTMPDVRQIGLPFVRPQAEAPVHNDSGGA